MKTRLLVIILMVVAALINAVIKFWGDWPIFIGVFGFQMFMVNSVYAYLSNKTIYLKLGSAPTDTDLSLRKFYGGVAFIFYVVLFLKT